MKNSIILLLLIALQASIFAQDNFNPGYIITNKNDTLRGYVDFRTENLNATICRFKQSATDIPKAFLPGQIEAYRLTDIGKYYVTMAVEVDSVKSLLFVEFLIKGKVNLYSTTDVNNLEHYYFEKDSESIVAISKKNDPISNIRFKVQNTWYSTNDNYKKYKADEHFRIILAQLFRESIAVAKLCRNADYNRETMIQLTRKYNTERADDNEKEIVFAKDNFAAFFDLHWSVSIGAEYVDFRTNYSSDGIPIVFNSRSIMPVVTGQLVLSNPRFIKSMSAVFDFSLAKFGAACDQIGKYDAYSVYKANALKVGNLIGLRYRSSNGRFHPIVEGGFCTSVFLFNASNLDLYDRYFVHNVRKNELVPETFLTGYRAVLGFEYDLSNRHKLSLKFGYENVKSYKDKLKASQLTLGYGF